MNTYALFAEHNWRVLAPRGCAGFIVPGGIVTDDTTKAYFQALLDRSALGSVHHFENESLVFKGLHHAYRFVLFTIRESRQADLVFYARRAVDLDDPVAALRPDARRFRHAEPQYANLSDLQIAARPRTSTWRCTAAPACSGGRATRTGIRGA